MTTQKKRINDIVKAFKKDAKASRKLIVQRPRDIAQKDKQIREIETKRNYSGEASPYWNFTEAHQRITDEGRIKEEVLANPDILTEEDSLYRNFLTERGEFQLAAIKETLPKLAPRERQAVLINRPLEEVAYTMGIKPRTARVLLERARAKIKRCYDRKLLQDSCSTFDQ